MVALILSENKDVGIDQEWNWGFNLKHSIQVVLDHGARDYHTAHGSSAAVGGRRETWTEFCWDREPCRHQFACLAAGQPTHDEASAG